MESNDYIIKLPDNCYARLPDGTPRGLIFDNHHKPIGLFIATCGKTKWLTLEMIEQKRREKFGENCRWDDMPVIVQDWPLANRVSEFDKRTRGFCQRIN